MSISDLSGSLGRLLLKTAADHSFSAITITRAASAEEPGEIIYVNGAFEDLTGYQAEEVIGQTPGVLQGPKTEQEVISRLSRKIAAGEVFHGRATNYRKDGSEFTMEWKVIPVAEGPVADEPVAEEPVGKGSAAEGGESSVETEGKDVIYHIAVQREAPADEE